MKISKQELGRVARNFLDVLDRESITSTSDLETHLNQEFEAEDRDTVSIALRPSAGTMCYTVSYNRPNTGIPIEAKINPFVGITHMILKTEGSLEEYSPFAEDSFGNIAQNRVFSGSDFSIAREELERLKKYT